MSEKTRARRRSSLTVVERTSTRARKSATNFPRRLPFRASDMTERQETSYSAAGTFRCFQSLRRAIVVSAVGREYSDDEKAAIAEAVREMGLAEASRQMDVPKTTAHRFAQAAGIDTGSPELVAQTRAATQKSVADRERLIEESKGRMTLLLARMAELSAHKSIERIQRDQASLHELVGCWTRAIHDLNLLGGNATENVQIEATVEQIAALRDLARERLAAVAN